jgi:hypothetical protein
MKFFPSLHQEGILCPGAVPLPATNKVSFNVGQEHPLPSENISDLTCRKIEGSWSYNLMIHVFYLIEVLWDLNISWVTFLMNRPKHATKQESQKDQDIKSDKTDQHYYCIICSCLLLVICDSLPKSSWSKCMWLSFVTLIIMLLSNARHC